MAQRKWTSEEEIELRKFHTEGLSPKTIAAKLDRSRRSILRKSDRLDLWFLRPDLETGAKFNSITILHKTERTIKGSSSYMCLCDCGVKFELGRSSILTGNSVSCGCIRKSNRIKPAGQSAKIKLFGMCRSNARNRDLEFLLTKEEHFYIISQPCSYCGAEPIKYNPYLRKNGTICALHLKDHNMIDRAWILANTIDRVDNNKGYFLDNCVTACWPCNKMKVDSPVTDFLDQVLKIAKFQNKKVGLK